MDRGPDFFALLRLQSDEAYVFLFEEKDGSVQGVATVLKRKAYVRGNEETVGYLGDLRTRFHRGPIRAWRGIFKEILAGAVTEFADCRHWLTAVIDDNLQARAALLHAKRGGHRYEPLTPYWMVNVFSRPLFRGPRSDGAGIRKATQQDLPRLTKFLDDENRSQAFGFPFATELNKRLAAWPNLRLKDFLLAESADGVIVGCAAPWETTPVKRIRVDALPFALRLLAPFLPEPVRLGEQLRMLYLTHLTIASTLPCDERGGIFRALFDEAWRASRGTGVQMVSFCSFEASPYQTFLEPCARQQIPMTLYSVESSERERKHWREAETIQPGFEMAIV